MRLNLLFLLALLSVFTLAETTKSYYPDGTIESAVTYKDGKKNGAEHTFYADGATLKYAKNYAYGKLHGSQQQYSQDALLIQEENYKHGRLDGHSRYYRKGLLKREVEYNHGMVDGTYREFYPSGLVKVEIIWRRDKAIEGYEQNKDGIRTSLKAKFLQNLQPSDIPASVTK